MDPGDKAPRASMITPGQPISVGADRKATQLEHHRQELGNLYSNLENLALRTNNLRDRLLGPRPEEVTPETGVNDAGILFEIDSTVRACQFQAKRIQGALADLEDAG